MAPRKKAAAAAAGAGGQAAAAPAAAAAEVVTPRANEELYKQLEEHLSAIRDSAVFKKIEDSPATHACCCSCRCCCRR